MSEKNGTLFGGEPDSVPARDASERSEIDCMPRNSQACSAAWGTGGVLFEASRDAIFVVDEEGRILEANPAASDTYGYDPDLLRSMTFDSVRHSISSPTHWFLSGSEVFEEIHNRASSETFPVEVQVVPMAASQHSLRIIRDVSDLARARDALSYEQTARTALAELIRVLPVTKAVRQFAAEALTRAMRATRSVSGLIGGIDPLTGESSILQAEGRLKWSRDVAARFGAPPRPIPGWISRHREPWFTNEGIEEQQGGATRTARRLLIVPIRIGETNLGSIVLADAGRPYTSRDLAFVGQVGSVFGVAMQRALEEERLRRATEAAVAGSIAKASFLGTMSHEIRTPLNGILSLADLLLQSTLDEEQANHVRVLRASGATLLAVLDDSLEFARLESGQVHLDIALFSPAECLTRAVDRVRERATAKGLRLNLNLSSALPVQLLGDQGRLEQVMSNLLDNAVKFTDRGEVNVSCRLLDRTSECCLIEWRVADTGIGIPLEAQRQIFDPFSQAESSSTRRHGGTGLGLCITRRLVELMGGTITVRSVPNHGSSFRFTVRLPLAEESAGQANGNSEKDPPFRQAA
ncbi:MAG: PAS domain-containing sensor histidine kinase [Candidatus Eisenbacteria bacterium]